MASKKKKSPPSSPPPLAPFQLFLALRLPPSATRLFPRSPAVLSPSSSRPPRFSPGRRLPVRGRERKAAPLFSFSRLSLTSPDAASPPAFLPPAASARLLLLPLVPYSPARPAVLSPSPSRPPRFSSGRRSLNSPHLLPPFPPPPSPARRKKKTGMSSRP